MYILAEEKRSEAAEVVSTAKLVLPMEMADENGFFACAFIRKRSRSTMNMKLLMPKGTAE